MSVWTALILGLLIGWLVEWVIDWIYWRQRVQGGTAELENVRAQNNRLRADIDAGAGSIAKLKAEVVAANTALAAATADRDRLHARIGEGAGPLDQLKADLATATTGLAAANADNARLHVDLAAANGSLDQYKSELGALNTSLSAIQAERDHMRAELDLLRAERAPADLGAAQDSEDQYKTQLMSIDPTLAAGAASVHLGDSADRSSNAEFERLRAELAGANGEVERLRAELAAERADSGAAQAAGSQYRTQLLSIDPALFDAGAGVHGGDSAELTGANDDIEPLRAEIAAPPLANAVGEQRRDPLIDINGIGPVYEQRLFNAGVYTFDDLAAQSPARLRELVGAKAWQEADTEAWIAAARLFAQGRSAQ